MLHRILNFFGRPVLSEAGEHLSVLGRLTYGWLWSDNEMYARTDAELEDKGQ